MLAPPDGVESRYAAFFRTCTGSMSKSQRTHENRYTFSYRAVACSLMLSTSRGSAHEVDKERT